jgi:hypothetical protein
MTFMINAMKNLTFSCLVIFVLMAFSSSSQNPVIFAETNGNNVTLWETGAYRNCGSLYMMEINLVDHLMEWYQVDTGLAAYCNCNFDLSVTYGPLEPGNYSVNVYYTESYTGDIIFEGVTDFTIGNINRNISSGIISQFQSDCYTGITDPEKNNSDFRIYPVPVREGGIVNIQLVSITGSAILEIFSLNGKLVFSKHYEGVQAIHDQRMKDELFPFSGLYFVRLRTGDQMYVKKINVF